MKNNVTNEKDNKRTNTLIVITSILAIVAIIFGGYIIINNKTLSNNQKEDNSQTNDKDNENVSNEEKIIIDASLATQPLTDAYIKGLPDFNLVADYSNTDPAYTKLINKEVDLIIVTEPSEEELKRAKDANVELEVTPVVNEGFVFYTNKENPVNNLTIEQIQKIYTGEITNWKQAGGNDAEIIAYQRPVNSGSQTGILSLVMKGLKMKEPKTTEYIETMAGIIEVVSNYENGKDAIGYSYYYYATAMYGNDKMKFFSINDIEPNHDTIKDGSYPLITSYYIVTLKNETSSSTEKLKKTLLSPKGQEIAKKAGYVELEDK